MSRKSCSNNETLLLSIWIMFLKFNVKIFFQMSFLIQAPLKVGVLLMMLR